MNPKLIVYTGFLLLMSRNITAQPPIQHFSNTGDSLYAEGKIPEAIAEYRKLIAGDPRNAELQYNLACAYSIDNSIIRQFDSCFKFLNIAVTLDTAFRALTDPDLLPAKDDRRWLVFEDRLISMLNIKFKNQIKDPGYAKALWRICANDQAFFNEIQIAGRKLGMRSSVASALWRAKVIIAERNQQELDTLLEAKGWPRIGNVGRDAAIGAYLVVQHSNAEMQEKYLPEVKKMCVAGELPWIRYALLYDRMCTNQNTPQRYGTHTRYNEKTNREELYPLENPSKTDEWRKELGLEPLSEYLAGMGIKYNPVGK